LRRGAIDGLPIEIARGTEGEALNLHVEADRFGDIVDNGRAPVDNAATVAADAFIPGENAFLVEHGISCLGLLGALHELIM
jgi:hypothetical protein